MLGLPLAGYTAVLIANTALPVLREAPAPPQRQTPAVNLQQPEPAPMS
ncbi:hypothetical protein [Archangium sp.]